MPCPSDSVKIDQMLDVAFTTPKKGVMLAVSNNTALMLATDDGGTTWTATP